MTYADVYRLITLLQDLKVEGEVAVENGDLNAAVAKAATAVAVASGLAAGGHLTRRLWYIAEEALSPAHSAIITEYYKNPRDRGWEEAKEDFEALYDRFRKMAPFKAMFEEDEA